MSTLGHNWARQRNLITYFQIRNEQQLPVIDQHHYSYNVSNWLLHLPTPTWFPWLVQKSSHPDSKEFCSLGWYSAPYCIGRLTENLNIPRKKVTANFLVQKIEEWIRKPQTDILLGSSIQSTNLFAIVRINFPIFQWDVKWSCKIGLDFQLKNLFFFLLKHLNSNSKTKCQRPFHMFIENSKFSCK